MLQATSHPPLQRLTPTSNANAIRRANIAPTTTLETLPPEPWDDQTWKSWTTPNTRGKSLYMPLRLVLTGESHGPELAGLLPLMARDLVVKRLERVIG